MPPLVGDDVEVATAAAPIGGDIFLLLDLPPESTVGCDAKALGTGTSSHFQGLRDIPPGPHFIWVSEPNAMSRCGYWFLATPRRQQVRVKQWDKFNEVLVTPPSDFEVRDMRDNVGRLYPQLVPYNGNVSSRPTGLMGAKKEEDDAALLWGQLTARINEKLLARVTGKADVSEWLVDTSDSAAGDEGFPQAKATQTYQTMVGTGELKFLFPEGDVDLHTATGPGATGGVPDTSMDILRLLDTPGTGFTDADLIGELQFTFLTGLHLSNLACIEQWWHLILKIVLRAHQLVILRPGLSLAFLTTLHSQMVYNEKYISPNNNNTSNNDGGPRHEYGGKGDTTSLLDVVPANKRKLREALTLYKRRMNELLLNLPGGGQVTKEQGQVGKAFVEVEEWFWKLGWDLRTDYVKRNKAGEDGEADDDLLYDEDDEYKPVIVDLDDHGREVGLVSFT